jgi:hypothetical protein
MAEPIIPEQITVIIAIILPPFMLFLNQILKNVAVYVIIKQSIIAFNMRRII